MQFISPHPTSLRSILKLSTDSHLPSVLFLSSFPTKILCAFLSLKNLRHSHCYSCLHQTSCLKVVELKASQEHQARTLFLLLKLVQSDSELFSQFVSQDCHKLLLKVLQSPRCIAGHHMLKVGRHYFMNGISVSLFLQADIGIVCQWNAGRENLHITFSLPLLTTSPPQHYHHFTNWYWTSLAELLHFLEAPSSNLGPETLTEDFMAFLIPSRQMLEWYLKLGHSHFLPHLFQVMTHETFYHSVLWNNMSYAR